MFNDVCEFGNCKNRATRLAAKAEGGIIDICDTCWHANYRS